MKPQSNVDEIERYVRPESLAEALDVLKNEEVTILAGGTDLMVQAEAGRVSFNKTLLNISRLAELKGVEEQDGSLRIGALVTVAAAMENDLVQRHLPALVEACDQFASGQVRNAATIGGNISNASPAGDTIIPLMVYGAEVMLQSAEGSRSVPIAEYFTGPGEIVRASNELLVGFTVPRPPEGHVARFFKFGTRPALDISAISIGLYGVSNGSGLDNVRVALGAVAPTPIRLPGVEEVLSGNALDAETIERAAALAAESINPIDDVRATAWYRKEMVHNMLKRILADAA